MSLLFLSDINTLYFSPCPYSLCESCPLCRARHHPQDRLRRNTLLIREDGLSSALDRHHLLLSTHPLQPGTSAAQRHPLTYPSSQLNPSGSCSALFGFWWHLLPNHLLLWPREGISSWSSARTSTYRAFLCPILFYFLLFFISAYLFYIPRVLPLLISFQSPPFSSPFSPRKGSSPCQPSPAHCHIRTEHILIPCGQAR